MLANGHPDSSLYPLYSGKDSIWIKWEAARSWFFLFLLALGKRPLCILEVFFEESLDDSFAGIDEPVVDLVNSQFWLPGHLLFFDLSGVRIVEVLKQPLLHDARRLQSDLAVFALTSVLLLDLLLFLELFAWTTQSTDQVARVPFNNCLQVCHFLRYLSE